MTASSLELVPFGFGGKKWDDHLLDIHREVKEGKRQIAKDTERIVRSVQNLAGAVTEAREQEIDAIERLGAEFRWELSLFADHLESQIRLTRRVVGQLARIQETLKSPLMTQAQELFQIGYEHYTKGLLDKALEVLLEAERKNEVNPPLQLLIGKLYVYGRDEDTNVINCVEGERHLLLAARYAEAYKGGLKEWYRIRGEALAHAGWANYLKAKDAHDAEESSQASKLLDKAIELATCAVQVWPTFLDGYYLRAKCHALLQKEEAALQDLLLIADPDRRYLLKAQQDSDFGAIHDEISLLFGRLHSSPGPVTRVALKALDEAVQAMETAAAVGATSQETESRFRALCRALEELRKQPERLDAVFTEIGIVAKRLKEEFFQFAEQSLETVLRQMTNAIQEYNKEISTLQHQIRIYKGDEAIGCLILTAMLGATLFLAAILIGIFGGRVGSVILAISVIAMIALYYIGRSIATRRKKSQWKNLIKEAEVTLDLLRKKSEEIEQVLHKIRTRQPVLRTAGKVLR